MLVLVAGLLRAWQETGCLCLYLVGDQFENIQVFQMIFANYRAEADYRESEKLGLRIEA